MGRITAVSPFLVLAMLLGLLTAVACSGGENEPVLEQEVVTARIHLTSSAFTEGADIPTKYTCDGEDVSPQLAWTGTPQGTRSIALVVDDPDAPGGTWVHWVLYGVTSDIQELSENIPDSELAAFGVTKGKNDFGDLGYGGPCPPLGTPHRYYFKLYALDTELSLESGVEKEDLLSAIDGHILASGQLMGKYQRR